MIERERQPVRILDDRVVNQIAAGEVVERPASVVKELVENSIDAGADEITVSITNGGRSSIEVIDNGCGVTKDDALLAVERFGTSKIRGVDDLQQIATHGFRGEALSSIASVSRFSFTSAVRSPEQGRGVQVGIDGGSMRDVKEGAFAPGTRVEVRNLFFNVPARRKFLRSENTEASLVRALMTDFALAYPLVRFRLIIDGAEVASHVPGKDFAQRARELKLAGERPLFADHIMQTAAGEVRVRAVLSQPVECVTNAGKLRLLVNRRSVRDKLLLKAVRDGFGNFLKPGRYPAGVLSLELPPSEVDVNVHPQKTEVRFRRPEIVFAAVTKAIRDSLLKEQPRTDSVALQGFHGSPFTGSHQDGASQEFWGAPAGGPATQVDFSAPAPNSVRVERLDQFRFVGQVLGVFLILEAPDQIALLDMHAAHERVTFYRLKCQLRGGGVHSQRLLIPEKIELPEEKVSDFTTFSIALAKLGIEADLIGEKTLLVRSTPALLGNVSAQAIFNELTALPEWSDWGDVMENAWDAALSRLACHRSIRSGRELEKPEVYELLEALYEADSSGFCPHGRPVAKFISRTELELMFGRARF